MNPESNKINQPPSVYTPTITVTLLPSPPIPWLSTTNPQIIIAVPKAVKTPNIKKPSTVKIVPIPRNTQIADWLLKSLLLVQLTPARKGSVATTWLEGIAEYGTAENETDAVKDLVISLGEYRQALEGREGKLSDSALKELGCLRKLIEPLKLD